MQPQHMRGQLVVPRALPVTVPGSRPPTESRQSICESGLLQKVPSKMKRSTVIFSDGNQAWRTEASRQGLRSSWVCHQNKEWTRADASLTNRALPKLAGTQVLDRAWLTLKSFIGHTHRAAKQVMPSMLPAALLSKT